jgi:hypothetical protein
MDSLDDNIDRYVLGWHQCEDQKSLNRFWDSVPEELHVALCLRLEELFPQDPNRCEGSGPYALRIRMIERGMCEKDAAFFVSLSAKSCAEREGRSVPCQRCEAFVADFGPEWAQ